MLQPVKTSGRENPTGIGTKDLAEKDVKRIMNKLGFREKTGRHPKALRTAVGAGSPGPAKEQENGEGLSQLKALD